MSREQKLNIELHTSRGFSIIEVLVAMVILSVGVLALSVLQLSSMQNTQGGHMRSQATMLAYDIIDAMRANPPALLAGNYSMNFEDEIPQGLSCYGIEANCTTAQIAAADLGRWRRSLATSLPSGSGQIVTAGAGMPIPQATVTVSWIDPYSADSGVEQVTLQAFIQ